MMHYKNLKGHSGCRVILIEDNDSVFIRKVSSSHDYNARLMLQAEKQRHFVSEYLSAPRIYGSGFTDEGLFYFDMEYISGITLAEYMKVIQVSSIKSIVKALMFSMTGGTRSTSADSHETFSAKIASLAQRLADSNSPIITKALDILAAHDWGSFALTPCHGDMTLENIIVKDGRLYLIDFLDSFCECWIMDAAALLQDVYTMWSYRHEAQDINTTIRLMIFRDIMTDMITQRAGAYFMREIYYALLLKLVRIYPYTRDKITLDFLNLKAASVMRTIDSLQ